MVLLRPRSVRAQHSVVVERLDRGDFAIQKPLKSRSDL